MESDVALVIKRKNKEFGRIVVQFMFVQEELVTFKGEIEAYQADKDLEEVLNVLVRKVIWEGM